jgi:hypothetical protein
LAVAADIGVAGEAFGERTSLGPFAVFRNLEYSDRLGAMLKHDRLPKNWTV